MNFIELRLWITDGAPYFAALRHNFRFSDTEKSA
jgi:hypothetical protein